MFTESTPINETHIPSPTHPHTGSARCVAWGQDHYRTFDNKIYHYKGACKRELDIYMGNDRISLKRDSSGPVVTYNGAVVPVPSSKGVVIFEKISSYIVVRSSIGFQIRWDTYEMVFVTVTDVLLGKTKVKRTRNFISM
ncbi:KCP-like protein [Mya arenaria]|uniref:KCP-like protein n=1 Tax=Mya arenaria TaxID=6604 RepID=A0ABY7EKU8_MYAAR|nr:KCP-like protein [Mya arenaria]